MASFILLPDTHSLHPLANRLLRDGHRVALAPRRDRFERAWQGRLTPTLAGPAKFDSHRWRDLLAEHPGAPILTDSPRWTEWTQGLPNVYGTGSQWAIDALAGFYTPVALGAWRRRDDILTCRHVWVEDPGAWPLGLGPSTPGAGTLIAADWPPALDALLPPQRGLVQARLQLLPTDGDDPTVLQPRLVEHRYGWHPLHWHAFAALTDLASALTGSSPQLQARFSVVLPISVPPWPIEGSAHSTQRRIDGLDDGTMGSVLWHDIEVRGGELWVGGLDGLVGVAYSAGDTLQTTLTTCLSVATRLRLPELGYRPDAAQHVGLALAALAAIGVAPSDAPGEVAPLPAPSPPSEAPSLATPEAEVSSALPSHTDEAPPCAPPTAPHTVDTASPAQTDAPSPERSNGKDETQPTVEDQGAQAPPPPHRPTGPTPAAP